MELGQLWWLGQAVIEVRSVEGLYQCACGMTFRSHMSGQIEVPRESCPRPKCDKKSYVRQSDLGDGSIEFNLIGFYVHSYPDNPLIKSPGDFHTTSLAWYRKEALKQVMFFQEVKAKKGKKKEKEESVTTSSWAVNSQWDVWRQMFPVLA